MATSFLFTSECVSEGHPGKSIYSFMLSFPFKNDSSSASSTKKIIILFFF